MTEVVTMAVKAFQIIVEEHIINQPIVHILTTPIELSNI